MSDARRYPAVSHVIQTGKSSSSVDRSADVSDVRRYQTRGEVSDARKGIRRAEVSDARRYPAGDVSDARRCQTRGEVSDARRYQTRGKVSDARRGIRRAEVFRGGGIRRAELRERTRGGGGPGRR